MLETVGEDQLDRRVGYKELLHRVKEEINTLHGINRREAKRLVKVLRMNCLLKHVTEG